MTYRVYLPYRYNCAYLHFDKFQCPPSCVHPCIEPNSHQQVDHIAAYTRVLEFLANFGDRPAYIETTNWAIFERCQLIGYWPGMKMLHQLLQYERRTGEVFVDWLRIFRYCTVNRIPDCLVKVTWAIISIPLVLCVWTSKVIEEDSDLTNKWNIVHGC